MKSRLLSRRELETLSEAGNPQALIAGLAKTPYRRSLEAALVRLGGREAIVLAMREELEKTVDSLRRFYRGDAAKMVALILRAYDVRNLKAVLRELSSPATPDDLAAALSPTFELSTDVLYELAQAASARAAIDLLASMGLPMAAPLIRLRSERPGAATTEMELRLEQWYFEEAFTSLEEIDNETLCEALQLEADLVNLQTVLRLAAAPDEQDVLQQGLGAGDVTLLFVGPGRIHYDLLAQAARQRTVSDAVLLLADTPYGATLSVAMEKYGSSSRLSHFEKALHALRLARLARLIARQPLGIGLLLGYLALKTNEVNNLRWITNGIFLGMKPAAIREELVHVP